MLPVLEILQMWGDVNEHTKTKKCAFQILLDDFIL
jgi:hypothetical protein